MSKIKSLCSWSLPGSEKGLLVGTGSKQEIDEKGITCLMVLRAVEETREENSSGRGCSFKQWCHLPEVDRDQRRGGRDPGTGWEEPSR